MTDFARVAPTLDASFITATAEALSSGWWRGRIVEWHTGRIGAFLKQNVALSEPVLTLRRIHGKETHAGLNCTREQFAALQAVADHWNRHRDRWTSFHSATSGFCGSTFYFQRPGAEPEAVGRHDLRHRTGIVFSALDTERPLATPLELRDGVKLVAELWHAEPLVGDPSGHLVGQVFSLPGGMVVRVKRTEALVQGAGERLWLECGEEGFLADLARVLN